MTTTQRTNTALVQGLYDAFGRGDIPAVLEPMTPDATWTEPAGARYAGTYTGPEAIAAGVFAHIAKEWTTFEVTPETFVEDGDTVVVLGWYDAVFGASGKEARARFAHVFQLTDGRISSFEAVMDTAILNILI